jgi:hypothetical protein
MEEINNEKEKSEEQKIRNSKKIEIKENNVTKKITRGIRTAMKRRKCKR